MAVIPSYSTQILSSEERESKYPKAKGKKKDICYGDDTTNACKHFKLLDRIS
jgi:hypothetical protein